MALLLFVTVSVLTYHQSVFAISVTPETGANNLTNALVGPGLVVTSSSISAPPTTLGTSSGIFTNPTATYGIGNGIVLSTGNVADYSDGQNTTPKLSTSYALPATPSQEVMLAPITGIAPHTHFDVTELYLTFDVQTGFDSISFDFVYGSEEWSEFVGSGLTDGFGVYLNGALISDSAFTVGKGLKDKPGTELDGISPLVSVKSPILSGSAGNTLTFVIGDGFDESLDSTVYISNLRANQIIEPVREPVDPAPNPPSIPKDSDESVIPAWIKKVAGFWCEDKIPDSEFILGIQYLIDEKIIIVPGTSGHGTSNSIPSWIKNNACWWSQDLITDSDFAKGFEYLIAEGIFQVNPR